MVGEPDKSLESLAALATATAALDLALGRLGTIGNKANDPGRTRAVQLMRRLCAVPALFPAQWFVAQSDSEPTAYPLRRAADGSRLMVVHVWPEGASGAPHEHGTWSLLGCVRGQGQHRRYNELPTLEREEPLLPGASCFLHEREIHSVTNEGKGPLLCLDVYGHDLADLERRQFDRDTGAAEILVTPRFETLW